MVLSDLNGSFENYTRNSWVKDEEQKKKNLIVILWVFFLLEGAMVSFNSLKEAIWKKKVRKKLKKHQILSVQIYKIPYI